MTCRELIRFTSERLLSAGVPDPVNDAALMLSYLTGIPALRLRMDETYVPNQNVLDAYEELVLKRMSRIPLQYLLHEAPFFRRVFRVDPRVLIPRPETELLCEWSVEVLKAFDFPRVLDLCCGSGCIGLTLKTERPDADVLLSDLSASALEVAACNAEKLSADVSFHLGDLLSGLVNTFSFDVIVSNPPYFHNDLKPQDKSRLQSKHGDNQLSFPELADSVEALMTENGRFVLILPPTEMSEFHQLALKRWHCCKTTYIRPTENKPVYRIVREYCRDFHSETESHFSIRNATLQYTPEYLELVNPYLTIR